MLLRQKCKQRQKDSAILSQTHAKFRSQRFNRNVHGAERMLRGSDSGKENIR